MASYFEVAMLGGGSSCTANSRNPLPRENNVTDLDEQVIVVGVIGLKSTTMINDDNLPIAAHGPAEGHSACRRRGHGLPPPTSNVQTRVAMS